MCDIVIRLREAECPARDCECREIVLPYCLTINVVQC